MLKELGNPHLTAVVTLTPSQEELKLPQLTVDSKDDEMEKRASK